MSASERSLVVVAQGESIRFMKKFPRFETAMRQRRLMSKIEPKFRTFWPPVKFRGGVGKLSVSICQVEPRTKRLIYFCLLAAARVWPGFVWKKQKQKPNIKACRHMSCGLKMPENNSRYPSVCLSVCLSVCTTHTDRQTDRRISTAKARL